MPTIPILITFNFMLMCHVLENHVMIKKMFMWKVRNYFNELLLPCRLLEIFLCYFNVF